MIDVRRLRERAVAGAVLGLAVLVVDVHGGGDAMASMAVGFLVVAVAVSVVVVRDRALAVPVAVAASIAGANVGGAFDADPARIGSMVLLALVAVWAVLRSRRPAAVVPTPLR